MTSTKSNIFHAVMRYLLGIIIGMVFYAGFNGDILVMWLVLTACRMS